MTTKAHFVQVNLGYGDIIIEAVTLGDESHTKAIAWYPSADTRAPGETVEAEPDDFSYRDNGGVLVTFKTDEDIDRLIENLQRLRSA